MGNYSRLTQDTNSFNRMMKRFGVVTVMNARVYDIDATFSFSNFAEEIAAYYLSKTPLCRLDTLKIANVPVEGPTKTVTGGQYTNPLIKFGKSARLEMQDALGNAEAIEALCGGLVEYDEQTFQTVKALHYGEDFAGPKLIIGDSFFIDQTNGQQVKVLIMFYQFQPDSLFNLSQDGEGDATVFDMNGDLLTTDILIGNANGDPVEHGVFYSIISNNTSEATGLYTYDRETGKVTLTSGYTGTLNGVEIVTDTADTVGAGTAAILVIKKDTNVVLETVLFGPEAE